MSYSLRPHGLQHARLPCISPSLRSCSNSCPLSQWCCPTISSFISPFSSCPWSFAMSQIKVLELQVAKVLELQHQSFQLMFRGDFIENSLVWSPCSSRASQESSPVPQFKSINSLVLSLLYGPTVTSIHDYRKNHSFDYMDFCQQSGISAFNMLSRFLSPPTASPLKK